MFIIPIRFKSAKEPKKMYTLNGTIHGYNPELDPYIEMELTEMFKFRES